MTPDDILAAARSAVGTPFRHQGRSLRGMDCAGLIIHVATLIGVEYLDHGGYGRLPSNGLLESALDKQPCLERVGINDMQAGDVLLMRFTGEPQHLGVFTGENIIHSYSTVGQACEHRLGALWRGRIVRVYRFKGLSHE